MLQSEGWARQDSNLGPRDYESPALTAELQARVAMQLNHNETRMTNLESVSAEILDKACDYIACLVGIAPTRHEGSYCRT